jgi:ribosomal protein S18 acetylase RimI-like enzyme
MPNVSIIRADYHHPAHARDLILLLDAYSRDPMGGNHPLSDYSREHLVPRLAATPHARTWLAYADEQPAGLLNAFLGFSTFAAQPILNLHDIAVLPAHRGRGLSRQLMATAEAHARELSCCKLTLEVLSGNAVATAAYRKLGFTGYALDPAYGTAQFWEKPLPPAA